MIKIPVFPMLCLSPIFTVPKPSGDLRVILNLKELNLFLPDQKFQIKTLSLILPQLPVLDWTVSIDLRVAYFHVLIYQQSRRLLGFQYQEQFYVYVALLFPSRTPLGCSPEWWPHS